MCDPFLLVLSRYTDAPALTGRGWNASGDVTIVDRDFVELRNLQRQLLFDEGDAAAGTPKAIAASLPGVRATAPLGPGSLDAAGANR